jgi:microcystin-dependent protein
VSLTTTETADNVDVGQTTGSSTTGITINSAGAHQHTIKTQGGNQPHNNMQPTIFVGNMFIYTGKPTYGKYPLPIPQTSPYPIL